VVEVESFSDSVDRNLALPSRIYQRIFKCGRKGDP